VHKITGPPSGFSKLSVSLDAFAGLPDVRVALHYKGTIANDWSVDNVQVLSPWTKLDGCVGGPAGAPRLDGSGPATPDSVVRLALRNAPPGALAQLVVGVAAGNTPFKGGVLVPEVGALLVVPADPVDGSFELFGRYPAGLPAGTGLFLQAWIADPSGPAGFLGSNALSVTGI
jgi:hypothetical protein